MRITVEHWLYHNKYCWWIIKNIIIPIHFFCVLIKFGFNRNKFAAYLEEKRRKLKWSINKREGKIIRLKEVKK